MARRTSGRRQPRIEQRRPRRAFGPRRGCPAKAGARHRGLVPWRPRHEPVGRRHRREHFQHSALQTVSSGRLVRAVAVAAHPRRFARQCLTARAGRELRGSSHLRAGQLADTAVAAATNPRLGCARGREEKAESAPPLNRQHAVRAPRFVRGVPSLAGEEGRPRSPGSSPPPPSGPLRTRRRSQTEMRGPHPPSRRGPSQPSAPLAALVIGFDGAPRLSSRPKFADFLALPLSRVR